MAKQTGQITVLKNNTVTNVEHQIRFIFAKENGERITRDTTSKGVINFDIPNGDWNVSWFAVDGDQKVLPLRAGLQLKITSSTPPTALADWIYGDNTHVADPILAQWTSVLGEMKAVRDQFRDETSFVGDSNGKIMREGAGGWLTNASQKVPQGHSFKTRLPSGAYALYAGLYDKPSWQASGDAYLTFGWGSTYYIDLVFGTNGKIAISATRNGNKSQWYDLYTQENTTVGNHGQLHDGKGALKDLLAVGDFGLGGTDMPITRENDPINRSALYRIFYNSGTFYYGSAFNMQYSSGINTLFGVKSVSHKVPTFIADHYNAAGAEKTSITFLTSGNTVIDSNGNYKPASPVVQLHHNKVEYNEDFDKDNPPEFEHLETGVYRITNVREICKDGWTYNKPLNGKSQPYFMIKYEQEDATTLLVRVFERTFNSKTGEFGFGEPRDIGVDERWIDFHFEVDHERIAREEAQMQKEQEEFEEQERLRKEAEEQEQAEATAAWEAEMARQEAEMIAEMEGAREVVAD